MADIVLTRKAFIKPLLHAAKYPHCAINGLLLAESSKHKEGKSLKLVDVVPLFHTSLTLAPMMEVALTMIDGYCQTSGVVIAGYYQANENLHSCEPTPVAQRIADKVRESCPDACLIMVDNEKAFREPENAFHLYTYYSDNKWKKSSDKQLVFEMDNGDVACDLIRSHKYRGIIDFDNHLDDISLDWRNVDINEQIDRCT